MAQIKTFARLKPTKKPYNGYVISKNVLTMHIPDSKDFVILGPQNNLRSNFSYDILFTNIFGCEATQEEVFDGVAKDIIQNFLNGYNGTIFAYGQTGTGKTYTVEGNTNRYSARGLATRALSMIYQELEKRSDQHISVYLSYLEIYQEVAYDLLNPAARSTIPIAPFARVTVVEGPRGSCILRGLSLHLAANEEIAQMLLLQGQANRKVAETPVNQRSSRSHAVFTVYLQVRKHDSDVLVNSKLHLVDLAGSERVSKTGVDGQQLTEAKSINLSLHHLETVIIALQLDKPPSSAAIGKGENPPQQSKSNSSLMSSGPSSDNGGSRQLRFVPYRNSLLTMVLKDSLGGNCLTAMIATISLEPENLGESISTCRFAQRVARIANNARRNEEVDDKALIKRLKNKVAYLENQVALLRSKGRSDPVTDEEIMDVLTDEDQRICERIMEGFLQGVITDPIEAGISDHCRFRACLHLLKHQFLHRSLAGQSLAAGHSSSISSALTSAIPGSSGAATFPGSNTSTSTLMPRPSCSRADLLVGANNPQQDSGDYAAVGGQGMVGQAGSGSLDGPKQSDGLMDSREQHSLNSYNVRTSRPLMENSPSSKTMRVGRDGTAPNYTDAVEGDDSGKNGPLRAKTKRGGIDDILQACAVSGGGGNSGLSGDQRYKSPFERRREKEIRRLSRKVTEMEEDKAGRESHLQQIKEQAIVEELLVAETGLRLKLQVAEEQVADQHAYLLQLKHLQADPDLITKEQLVEKQLRKRQAKFHEKLSKVLASKETLEQDFAQGRSAHIPSTADGTLLQQNSDSREGSSRMSLEERFGQYRQGKGALNTRQVFDLLKNEEKKQQKESQKVERETTMVKTKQLAIKEAATLEKLRELKQMLKLSLLKEEQQQKQQQPEEAEGEGANVEMLGLGGFIPVGLNASSSCKVGDISGESSGHGRVPGLHYSSTGHGGQQAGSPGAGGPSYSNGHHSYLGSSSSSRGQAWGARSPGNQNQSQHCSTSGITAEQSLQVQQFMAEMLGGATSDKHSPGNAVGASGQNQFHHNSQQQLPVPTFSLSNSDSTLTGETLAGGNSRFGGTVNGAGPSQFGQHKEATAPSAVASQSFHEPRNSFKFLQEDSGGKAFVSSVPNNRHSEIIGREKPARFASKDQSRDPMARLNVNANNATVNGVDSLCGDGELLMSDLETSPVPQDAVMEAQDRNNNNKKLNQSKTYMQQNKFEVQGSSKRLEPSQGDDNAKAGPLSASSNYEAGQENSDSPLPSLLALQQFQRDHNIGPVVPPSEYINSMSNEDQFDARRMGLSSRTFESALNHMLEGDDTAGPTDRSVLAGGVGRNAPDLPYSVDPYEGFSRSPRSSNLPPRTGVHNLSLSDSPYRQHRAPHHGLSQQQGQSGKSPTRDPRILSRDATKARGDFDGYKSVPASAWGPESKNVSVADRLASLLDSPSLQKDELTDTSITGKGQRRATSKKAVDIDPFETKLAKYKSEAFGDHVNDRGNSGKACSKDDKDGGEDDEEDDSFFGLQPTKTKLTALSAEEGEQTFMSTVAAEKARVEKIRRARNAAEIIQRRWRRFRARQ